MNKQLYSFIPDIEYPALVRPGRNADRGSSDIHPGYYSFVWPNGSPCILVEMFLQEKGKYVKTSKLDGGTVGNYASHLSHLVRYCFDKRINFWELTHHDIDGLVLLLTEDVDIYNERIRNNNTVKTIVADCMAFLDWLQNNIAVDRNIVGINTATKRFQIRLKGGLFSSGRRGAKDYEVFPTKLPASTTRPKTPTPTLVIKQLWDALDESKSEARCSNKLKGLFSKSEQANHIEYMHKRRELQLVMLEATGLRPQELTTMSASKNLEYLKKSQVLLPTLKTRMDSVRLIPIDRAVAMRLQVFLSVHRKKLIDRLVRSGVLNNEGEAEDYIYLNPETGRGVMPDAAYQEFRKLTQKAGIEQKNCQSMFRHRFVTNMVKLHLISFMDKNPLKSRQIMTDSDYRTILTKVSKFTGHKSVDSLLHYIDMAWEELGAFSHSHEVKNLQDKLKSVFYSIHSLKADVSLLKDKPSRNRIESILNQISEIEELTLMSVPNEPA